MTGGRACLAALAATALLALAPEAGPTEPASRAVAKARADGAAAPARAEPSAERTRARARFRAKRARWRAATSALRLGPGALLGARSAPVGHAPTPGGGGPGAPGPGSPAPAPPPVFHTLSVASREFSLTLSRQLLTPGTQTIQLNNRGEDPHNLVIGPDDGSHQPLVTYPDVESLESHTDQVELPAGRYKLWCSLAGHEALGMRATLRVE